MKKGDVAYKKLAEYKMNCCQAILTTFCKDLGLDEGLAMRLAGGFGGGMCSAKTCGVVTGAYMVLGLRQHPTPDNAQEMRDQIHRLIAEFNSQFIALHGSTDCKDLMGMDASVPGGYEKAKEKGLFETICPGLGRDSAEILEKLKE